MTFRFANVDGHAALVDSGGWWYGASRVSRGTISGDPMRAMIVPCVVSETNGTEPDSAS